MGKSKHNRISFGEKSSGFRANRETPEDETEEKTEMHFQQPELLPSTMMIQLLIKRGATENSLLSKEIEKIIRLFYKHITPKPQRQYKQNRIGQILMSRRKKSTSHDEEWKSMVMKSSGQRSMAPVPSVVGKYAGKHRSVSLFSNDNDTQAESRLKPAIDSTGVTQNKKIKLNSSSSFENIVIKKREGPKNPPVQTPIKLAERGGTKVSLNPRSPSFSSIVINKREPKLTTTTDTTSTNVTDNHKRKISMNSLEGNSPRKIIKLTNPNTQLSQQKTSLIAPGRTIKLNTGTLLSSSSVNKPIVLKNSNDTGIVSQSKEEIKTIGRNSSTINGTNSTDSALSKANDSGKPNQAASGEVIRPRIIKLRKNISVT